MNADSDAIIFGYVDIFLFDFQMTGIHCSCTCYYFRVTMYFQIDSKLNKLWISRTLDMNETEIIEYSVPMWSDGNYVIMKEFS